MSMNIYNGMRNVILSFYPDDWMVISFFAFRTGKPSYCNHVMHSISFVIQV